MGQVFTWDQVVKRQVPNIEYFPFVVKNLTERLRQEPAILGAIACGSVVRNDYTVRSDVDCVIIYDHRRQSTAFEFMRREVSRARRLHVPLSFIPCDERIAGTHLHHCGGAFRQHLEKSVEQGGLLKGDPLDLLAPSTSEIDDIDAYLRVKMHNLQEAWAEEESFSDERRAAFVKKLLEAPLHVARRCLYRFVRLQDDSKGYIRQMYVETMPDGLATQFMRLVALDKWYSTSLNEHLSEPSRAYLTVIDDLVRSAEDVLTFIRGNILHIAQTAP